MVVYTKMQNDLTLKKNPILAIYFIQNISLGETTYISSISTTWVLLESSYEFMFYSFLRKIVFMSLSLKVATSIIILFACISRVMLQGEENFYSLIISFLP